MIRHISFLARNEVDWNAVYAEMLPRIYNYFRYRLGDDPQAEDLTSVTFEKAWRMRRRYRHDLGAFSTWLFTIARNTAIDSFRSQRAALPLDEATPAAGPALEEQVQINQDHTRLAALLAGLPERERELIALKYGADLTNREIARLTGISESNVGTLLYRMTGKLRRQWEETQ